MEEKKINSEFELSQTENVIENDGITEKDFALVGSGKKIREQKFQTRPTTFLKDSVKRFAKNKSSLVAAGILGALILLAITVPIFNQSEVGPGTSNADYKYLEPKLFDKNDLGLWDGTKKYTNISVDTSEKPDATTEEEKQEYWWPNKKSFEKIGISKKEFTNLQYAHSRTDFGIGGYLQLGYTQSIDQADEFVDFYMNPLTVNFDLTANTYVSKFEVYDLETLKAVETKVSSNVEGYDKLVGPDNYELTGCALYFNYTSGDEVESILLKDYSENHNVGGIAEAGTIEEKINITEVIKAAAPLVTEFKDSYISVRVENNHLGKNTCYLLKSLTFETESTVPEMTSQLVEASITDASSQMREEYENGKNYKFWSSDGKKGLYCSKVIYCSFVYDTYEAVFGTKMWVGFSSSDLENYREKGWVDWNADYMVDPLNPGQFVIDPSTFVFEILNKEKCPIAEEFTIDQVYVDSTGEISVTTLVTYYKYKGLSSMPRFLAGTDKSGNDMFKYVFAGLGISLALGFCTFIVCFLFGLAWGAISGYFGGTVDLIMERVTDILSGVPWIVVMTLAILKLGSNIVTFGIAICLTGWIGTASLTRTQFYRFRGREYVLASRTLGASNFRLIFKHILPNAMGTIITSSVLMIPSVIFSEATISFLGLGLKNLPSLGVILSNNQSELLSNPYLLVFPSVVIALLMISFNLFGNGLRDAVNPSLKGEGE